MIRRSCCLVLALMLSCAVYAQRRHSFDIPAQSASTAIERWAEQSGLQVFAAADDLRGVRTNTVRGEFAAVEAAQLLLAGTGLEAIANDAATVTIRRARGPGVAAGAAAEKLQGPSDEPPAEIIVTGSRVPRPGIDTLQATLVTDSQQIERRGYTNVGQALNDVPGFAPSGADTVGMSQPTHSIGQTFVNLFNLGSQRTLVLVNGRRYVSSNSAALGQPAGSQVDLNTIPVGLIDRVETISIGGAPVYGSDAIAGTVNIVLKRDFVGVETSARYGRSAAGDGEGNAFRVLWGENFAAGRGNVAAGFEYDEQQALTYQDRYPGLYHLLANPADTGPSDGIAALRIGTFEFPFATLGGLPYDNALAPLFGHDLPGATAEGFYSRPNYIYDAAGTPLHFAANGELVPFAVGTVIDDDHGRAPARAFGGDGWNPAGQFSLLAPTRRLLVNAIGHYDIASNTRAIFEASYAHSTGRELSELYVFAAPGFLGGSRLTFSVDNPFLSAQARQVLVDNLGAGATFDVNRTLNDLTDRIGGETAIDLYRFLGGFEGELAAFGAALHWDVSFNHGRSHGVSKLAFIDPARLQQAIDVVADAQGRPICREPSNSCVPLNLFGAGNFTDQALRWVVDPARAISTNTLQVLTANLGAALPFGIAFNLGAEHREESAEFAPDVTFQRGDTLIGAPGETGAALAVAGEFATHELYAELLLPLVADHWRWPAIRTASLEGALRRVDHSLAGADTTWSLGIRLAPRLQGEGGSLQLRGVYTEAIRSPAVRELFARSPTNAATFLDPCDALTVDTGRNPAARRANCQAALSAAGATNPAAFDTTATTALVHPSGHQVGTPDLDNEQARSWSLGIVYHAAALPQVRVTADWVDIELTGGITPLGIGALMALCYDSVTFPNEFCGGFRRLTPAEVAAQPPSAPPRQAGDLANGFAAPYFNLARLHFQGAIVAADADFDIGPGSVRAGSRWFHTSRFEETAIAGDQALNEAGARRAPKHTLQLQLGYGWGRLDLDWETRWKSAVRTGRGVSPEVFQQTRVRSYALHHLTAGYEVTSAVRVQIGVQNLLDEKVPLNALPGGIDGYDPIGRRYFMTFSAELR